MTTIPVAMTRNNSTATRLRSHRAGVIAPTRYRRGQFAQEYPAGSNRNALTLVLIAVARTVVGAKPRGRHTA